VHICEVSGRIFLNSSLGVRGKDMENRELRAQKIDRSPPVRSDGASLSAGWWLTVLAATHASALGCAR
jgi:hypothetical protein